jgi:hypothetical protein
MDFDNPLVFIACFVIGSFALIFGIFTLSENACKPMLQEISDMGYDAKDVRVFLRRIDGSLENFLESKGLRLQYQAFSRGESTDFIRTAEVVKKANDARASGQATGMATGMAIGISMR